MKNERGERGGGCEMGEEEKSWRETKWEVG